MKKTLFDKVWDAHVVDTVQDGPQVLYIDKHLIHEVTSPQAFNELVDRDIPVFRPIRLWRRPITTHQRWTSTCQSKMNYRENNSHNCLKTAKQ